jgi:hypothetical protein
MKKPPRRALHFAAIAACSFASSSCLTTDLLADKHVPYAHVAIKAGTSLSWNANRKSEPRFLTCELSLEQGRTLACALPHTRPESRWLRIEPLDHADSLWHVADGIPNVQIELQILDFGDGHPIETRLRVFDLYSEHPDLEGYRKQRYALNRFERVLVIPCRVRSIEELPVRGSAKYLESLRIEHSRVFDHNHDAAVTVLLFPLALAADAVLLPFEVLTKDGRELWLN